MLNIVRVSLSCMASWPRLGAEALLHGALCVFQECITSPGDLWEQARCCMFWAVCLSVSGWNCPPGDGSFTVCQLWFAVPCTEAGIQAGSWLLGQTWPKLLSAWEGTGPALLSGLHSRAELCQAFLSVVLTQSEQGHPWKQDFPSLFFPATTVPCALCNNKYWEKLS